MILEARELCVKRGGSRVIRDISFTTSPGQVIGLIGPNGAGKTSLLRALSGLDPLAEGTLLYDGRSAYSLGAARMGRTVSYLAQNGRIHWPMRVDHLVALGRLPHGAADPADPAVQRALNAADVADLRTRTTGALSGGERARVLLARALAVEAPLLLADEPVAALDPYHQLQVMELMRATARGGTAVIVVLHDLTLAARFCDHLLLLQGGTLLAQGRSADVLTEPLIAQAYGVSIKSGMREGEPFIVPWRRRLTPDGAAR
jgi:iron complex transport system ATP-binding protein